MLRFSFALTSFAASTTALLATIALNPLATAQNAPVRPAITGISHLAVYTSNPAATERYYTQCIGAAKAVDPENPLGVRYMFSPTQYVEVLPLPKGAGINRLDHTAYNTENAEGLRAYLAAKGWKVPAKVTAAEDGSRRFLVLDPEQNKVEFVQPPAKAAAVNAPKVVGTHIIHLGMLVRSREVEDTFYKMLLGFKPYWFGGMMESRLDWVSQQVPESHDWLEYMLGAGKGSRPDGSGIPDDLSQHDLGVLDHLSIGEVSVESAYKTLVEEHRLVDVVNDGHTQIGKDGKGQFNLYDPDGIRLELMNFHATEKPCCSPFTAPDPAE